MMWKRATKSFAIIVLLSATHGIDAQETGHGATHTETTCRVGHEPLDKNDIPSTCNSIDDFLTPRLHEPLDVMILYTKKARDQSEDIEETIAKSIETANTDFQESNIPLRLQLVYTNLAATGIDSAGNRVPYEEAFFDDLDKALNWAWEDEFVKKERQQYGADIVSIFMSKDILSGTYGLAWRMQSFQVSPAFSPLAYNVVRHNRAIGKRALGHELAHNLGIQHQIEAFSQSEWDTKRLNAAFCFAFAYQDPDVDFHSITGTQTLSCLNCEIFSVYSSPLLKNPTDNQTFGEREHADAARVLGVTGPIGQRFRPSNDRFSQAKVIRGIKGNSLGSLNFATRERDIEPGGPIEPIHSDIKGGPSLWWRWIANSSHEMIFSTEGSEEDVGLAIYEGTSLPSLTKIIAADAAGSHENVRLRPTVGDYYIAVEGAEQRPSNNDVHLSWRPATSFHDLAVTASNMTGPVEIGKKVELRFSIMNLESITTPGVVGRALLPKNVEYISAQSSPECSVNSDRIIECNAGDIPPGEHRDFSVTVQVLDVPDVDIRVISPKTPETLSTGDHVDIEWVAFNTKKADDVTISMKRDAVPQSIKDADGMNWHRFPLSFKNTGREFDLKIPLLACNANDWRLYVGHHDSGEFDGTDIRLSVVSLIPCPPVEGANSTERTKEVTLPSGKKTAHSLPSVMTITFEVSAGETEVNTGDNYFEMEVLVLEDAGGSGDLAIDIKPGSELNPVNPSSRGKIPVAILSSPTFDATTGIVQESLTFGRTGVENSLHYRGNGAPNCGHSDINSDGFIDLVCHFFTEIADFHTESVAGYLKARTQADGVFVASEAINIVGFGHDSDEDGVGDDIEEQGPNSGDGNVDGLFDVFQENVTSLNSVLSGEYITLVSSPGCVNTDVLSVSPDHLPADIEAPLAPVGYVAFTLESCNQSSTEIIFHGHEGTEFRRYRRFGRTTAELMEHWYDFPVQFTQRTIGRTPAAVASFYLLDGGPGDDDLVANGKIVDPGGPILVGATGIPVLSGPGMTILVMLILGVGTVLLWRRSG